MPPRRVGFSRGFTVTQTSSYAVVAPVTRVSAIVTRVPSMDSYRSRAYADGSRARASIEPPPAVGT